MMISYSRENGDKYVLRWSEGASQEIQGLNPVLNHDGQLEGREEGGGQSVQMAKH